MNVSQLGARGTRSGTRSASQRVRERVRSIRQRGWAVERVPDTFQRVPDTSKRTCPNVSHPFRGGRDTISATMGVGARSMTFRNDGPELVALELSDPGSADPDRGIHSPSRSSTFMGSIARSGCLGRSSAARRPRSHLCPARPRITLGVAAEHLYEPTCRGRSRDGQSVRRSPGTRHGPTWWITWQLTTGKENPMTMTDLHAPKATRRAPCTDPTHERRPGRRVS